ncbi:MAG: toxic anion resistance protein [Bdellovibrionaceae bacterium]|nr:toxic anion resistance protein [Pseudobdellovibrionaceae bacterium]NUM57485.1 toxic anion resistance protein [Pseudobdellovibrionaceae bacterium]
MTETKTETKENSRADLDNLLSVDQIKKDLAMVNSSAMTPTVESKENSNLDSKADEFVQKILNLNPQDYKSREEHKSAVDTFGLDLQREAAKKSEMLKQPVKKLSDRSAEGGDVANSLINLKMKVEELDPAKFNFEEGWASRTLGFIPGVGKPLKKYFSKFESAQDVIGAIIKSLEVGRDQLTRDNITLVEDQKMMREITLKLESMIKLSQTIDQKLSYKLEREVVAGSEQYQFLSEEILFPLRQRIIDLQQQMAVNQQGVIATEIIMRNNKELIRGVNRSLNVTVSALQVAATVAMALANQKIVLDKINSVNQTTNDLIAGTASRLKTQGVEIQKNASSASLNMDTLKLAFQDMRAAMDDISQFRQKALPQMAQAVLQMDKLTEEAKQAIDKMDKGNRAQSVNSSEKI